MILRQLQHDFIQPNVGYETDAVHRFLNIYIFIVVYCLIKIEKLSSNYCIIHDTDVMVWSVCTTTPQLLFFHIVILWQGDIISIILTSLDNYCWCWCVCVVCLTLFGQQIEWELIWLIFSLIGFWKGFCRFPHRHIENDYCWSVLSE